MGDRVWTVRRGAETVGEVAVDDGDFPWLSGRFTPGPAYADLAPLFARELALLEDGGAARAEEWGAVYARIEEAVELVAPDGPVAEFLLHIKDDRACFRWNDEPFEED
ncbi:hypothetical protein ACIPPJ_01855 [Streptomyces sp. NPDC086091]|uniref:hypothetical protein n=1 Tax=Streptomyces sp. NPDC086091 TaxID=3365751 RepID=UPI00380592B8